ncbi:hypothetical protein CDAR_396091 [Caerostris darwini]|uniref:Uncharacterized protein n=1 Tax=Caerostris darwini TaxID=1538125 RepID=A0AAV4WNA4_9ARAC|nr:hypothetical protein CDAR_396091 [Caerostris darwini]
MVADFHKKHLINAGCGRIGAGLNRLVPAFGQSRALFQKGKRAGKCLLPVSNEEERLSNRGNARDRPTARPASSVSVLFLVWRQTISETRQSSRIMI